MSLAQSAIVSTFNCLDALSFNVSHGWWAHMCIIQGLAGWQGIFIICSAYQKAVRIKFDYYLSHVPLICRKDSILIIKCYTEHYIVDSQSYTMQFGFISSANPISYQETVHLNN